MNERSCKPKMILIYAWNEYGEGGYIAPTVGDPKGKYLKMIKEVIRYDYRNSIYQHPWYPK